MNKTTEEKYRKSRLYGAKWIGKWVTDCSGLIYWAMMQLGVKTVHHARYLYTDFCKRKGKLIDGKPDDGHQILPGTCVFLKGSEDHIHHCGVYVGHGVCVEAKGVQAGVVQSELSHWDYWGELKDVDYTNAAKLEDEPIPEIPARTQDYVFQAIVNDPGSWVNLRSKPNKDASRLAKLYDGEIVDVVDAVSTPNWWQVKYHNILGWASAEYLIPLNDEDGESDDNTPDDPVVPPFEEPEEQPTPPDDAVDDPDDEIIVRPSVLDDLQSVLQTLSDVENRLADIIRRL